MTRAFYRQIRILLLAACLPALHAQTGPAADYTADELLLAARNAYNAGKWPQATTLYEQFLSSFGQAEGIAELLPRIRYDLAFGYLQQRKYAEALEKIDLFLGTPPPPAALQLQEMTFWKGVCEMQEEACDAARATLEKFIGFFPPTINPVLRQQNPSAGKVEDAKLLVGSIYLLQEKYREAAEYLAAAKKTMAPETRGRATVLELYALLQSGEKARALDLVVAEFPRAGELTQLAAFQTLSLQLGSELLEAKEYRKAILCLQRIWSADRLLKHQEGRLAALEERLQALEANPKSDPYQKFLATQMIAKIKREIENFRKIAHYDAALRLRLATAYQAMKRYREAGLILEAMLREMPPSPVVEAASVNLVQCWFAIERWPKVVESAQAFAEKFPQSKSRPLALYLAAIAEQKDLRYAESIALGDAILKNFPQSEFAPRALFMKGFTQLLAERNPAAIQTFEEFQKAYPDHELAESALYWRGMGCSLDKQFEKCREVMDEYLGRYPAGAFVAAAKFRQAYAAQQLMDFPRSIAELHACLRAYPEGENVSEALVLLGDAYMNQGEMELGIAAFKRIPPADRRFFEEGWFKAGKALKLMEQPGELRRHMERFRGEHPRSPRVAEAIYWIGWVYKQQDQPGKAREVYWSAIREWGNDPAIRSVDDLIPALAKLYKGSDEQAQLAAELSDLAEEAKRRDEKTLAMRALWGEGYVLRKSNPGKASQRFQEAAALANVQTANPLLLADFAEACQLAGQEKEAARMWRDLVKWNPRAPQKDRALCALGLDELRQGNAKAALDYFDRFERDTLGSSRLLGKVMLTRARLLEERGQPAKAAESLETLLANKTSSGLEKAEALYRIAEMHMKNGKPGLAVPYYQRIYVMHGRWRDW
ncbi:MAG TPA: tetratricopeptide repeat protein, partial [Chthoniobacterales bacterium]